jgi:hypothetical protein
VVVTEAPDIGGGENRLKAAGPTAAAIGIITTIIGVSLIANAPKAPSPAESAPVVAQSSTSPGGSPPPVIGAPQTQFNQPGGVGAAETGIEIVVKFKDDGRVKDIIDAFWRDQGSAKAKFETWKANRPEFAGLRLDRVTYSNELVLVHDGSVPAAQRLSTMRTIAGKLGAAADISYAEPNLTAHPGAQ